MEASYLSEWAMGLFGEKWFTTGHGNLTFLKPVLSDETVTLAGVVSKVGNGDDGNRVEIETWVDNARGQHVAVGWFSSELDAVGPHAFAHNYPKESF
jgi:acyl dehydratase